MTTPDIHHRHEPRAGHLVHPRWVWGGLVVLLIGAALLAAGILILSWTFSIIGVILMGVGSATGLAAGVMYDAESGLEVRAEMKGMLTGNVHPGVAAGDMVHTDVARRDAIDTTARTNAALTVRTPSTLTLTPLAGWLLLAVPALVFVAEPFFLDHGAVGRESAFRDEPLAIVIGLAGLWIAVGLGRHMIAVLVAGLAGAGLLLAAILAPHDWTGVDVIEAFCGVFTILVALAAGLQQRDPN